MIEHGDGIDVENLKIFMNLWKKYNEDQLTREKDTVHPTIDKKYSFSQIFSFKKP